jgi:hypothetical protein
MTKLRSALLANLLRARPRAGSAELCAQLGGIDRSTLARGLRSIGEGVVARGGSRRRRYALRRPLRGDASAIPLFRIDPSGRGREIGQLELTHPAGTALSFREPFPWPLDGDMADGWFDGLPYPLVDMRPQGFLGRNLARNHALDLDVADDPERWSDDDVLYVLAVRGNDLPGDLILGETAYRRFLDGFGAGGQPVLDDGEIEQAYPRLAELALAHGEAASSAGGEFPKFIAPRSSGGVREDVIVKFSGADESPAVRRWADLLVCEHLALETLKAGLGIATACSRVLRHGGRTFLESVRFDRHGERGRSGVCTLASLNPALLGMGGAPWHRIARALHGRGWLTIDAVERIARVWWFGRLIANTDMHEGNLAFRPGLALAPIYDMLPMLYAPLRGGEVPERAYQPELPLPAEQPAWADAAGAAARCWESCAADPRISSGFRRICEANALALARVRAG